LQNLPFSQACENNQDVILDILARIFRDSDRVLEVGSCTAQHATHFAQHLSHLQWQSSDTAINLPLMMPRCAAYMGGNLAPPVVLDVRERPWAVSLPLAVFTANSLHIMPFSAVEELFGELGERCGEGTLLAVYGPFNYDGSYTSDSNARFDQWLAQQHPESAIRDFEAVNQLAELAGFALLEDNSMPANNRLLVWRKLSPAA
jgi:hypothetical protein